MPGKTVLLSDLGLQTCSQPDLGSSLGPSIKSCKPLGKSPKLDRVKFSNPQNVVTNSNVLLVLLRGFNQMMTVKDPV